MHTLAVKINIMKSFVLVYNFNRQADEQVFKKRLHKKFELNEQETINGLPYFGFAADSIAQVEEWAGGLIQGMSVGDDDIIAIYYTREADSDNIKRSLMFGQENRFDSMIADFKDTEHKETLTRLLNIDFAKVKGSKQ